MLLDVHTGGKPSKCIENIKRQTIVQSVFCCLLYFQSLLIILHFFLTVLSSAQYGSTLFTESLQRVGLLCRYCALTSNTTPIFHPSISAEVISIRYQHAAADLNSLDLFCRVQAASSEITQAE